ncbi:N-acetyl-gamma-glutamyl-phosphate reductase [Beijerinckia indica]|uniref:N-acetyl-gamma-glutamyl-phosphate reductase n=1 Tax=Beijerinckia indica subsp. indica (strain ATCC 9039 / DSM 1715 / NCIMB 8712) TaxID=395963 RepID=B2IK88_BEII9|nr:N-acetyl-gamma-glutamyl-phosphate reductase [Beijerinckia indica]ACB95020.1 N-acetyl-gamma-glutamyl-phosphate reductase [Beijerinckia indica subsp. indica ATCC 9039]
MPARLFIDGEAGTTGLGIKERLAERSDIELVSLPAEDRKNEEAKRAVYASVDLAILCLPDDAAREAVALTEDLGARAPRLLDASTAHRTTPGWTYGFPELTQGQAEAIKTAPRVANPGCYATGAIALLRPLVEAGFVPSDWPVSIHAVSGYSGGGKSMIAAYEAGTAPAFEAYALGLGHKHVPEIMAYGRLAQRPIFTPSVGNFRQGMLVFIPLFLDALPRHPKIEDLSAVFAAHYAGSTFVHVRQADGLERLEPQALNGTNELELFVCGPQGGHQAVLAARLDNLGKGASGAALQNVELMLGLAPQG